MRNKIQYVLGSSQDNIWYDELTETSDIRHLGMNFWELYNFPLIPYTWTLNKRQKEESIERRFASKVDLGTEKKYIYIKFLCYLDYP